MENKEIVDANLDLIRTCVECQFTKVKDRFTKQFQDDLQQDIYIALIEYDNEKLNDAVSNNHLNALITQMIINSIWSKTSPFYRKYKKFVLKSDDIYKQIEEENGGEENTDI